MPWHRGAPEDRRLTDDEVRRLFPDRDPRKLEVVLVGEDVYRRDTDGTWRVLHDEPFVWIDADSPGH
jgi:hypothetical protein